MTRRDNYILLRNSEDQITFECLKQLDNDIG